MRYRIALHLILGISWKSNSFVMHVSYDKISQLSFNNYMGELRSALISFSFD